MTNRGNGASGPSLSASRRPPWPGRPRQSNPDPPPRRVQNPSTSPRRDPLVGRVAEPEFHELKDLESWWHTALTGDRRQIAPLHDWRLLHSDARFANVRVGLASGSPLIDYGNGRHGHVFQDLARFESELLFRSSPLDAPDRGRRATKITRSRHSYAEHLSDT